MGFLDFLSPALTAGTEAASANQAAKVQGSQLMRAILMQELNMEKERAGIASTQATTDFTRHRNQAPVLGQPGYAQAMGDVKGAEANAEVAPHVDQAVQTAQGVAPIHTEEAVNTAKGVAPIHVQQAIDTAKGTEPFDVDKAVKIATGTLQPKKDLADYTSGLTLGRERALIPERAAAEAAAFKSRQDITPLNPDESVATTQLPRMAGALRTIKALQPSLQQSVAKGTLGNYFNNPQGRAFNQAATQAALAGALATEGPRGAQPDRVEYFKKTYIPQAGDDPATIQQKLDQFKELMRGVKTKSGRGYSRLEASQQQTIDDYLKDGGPSAPIGGAGGDTSANPFSTLPKAKKP